MPFCVQYIALGGNVSTNIWASDPKSYFRFFSIYYCSTAPCYTFVPIPKNKPMADFGLPDFLTCPNTGNTGNSGKAVFPVLIQDWLNFPCWVSNQHVCCVWWRPSKIHLFLLISSPILFPVWVSKPSNHPYFAQMNIHESATNGVSRGDSNGFWNVLNGFDR